MKDFFISDCPQQENKVITSSFVVVSKQVKAKKTGEPYLALTLGDRTGQVEAKMWDNVEEFIDVFEQDDFLKIKGLINKYKNRFQLTIHKLRRMQESEIEYADYLPKTTKDIGELWQTLASFVASIENPHLKALLELFMADPEIAERYRNAPAAKSLHHAYIGGLLDHVVSLFRSCNLVCRNYPQINRDLLLTGAFLHDIGKIYELTYNRSFTYTTRGQLLGHMIIELEMLHYLDDLDSKMEAMRAHFEREADQEAPWTSYNASLGRPLLNSTKFLQGERAPETSSSAPEESAPEPAANGTALDLFGNDTDEPAPTEAGAPPGKR